LFEESPSFLVFEKEHVKQKQNQKRVPPNGREGIVSDESTQEYGSWVIGSDGLAHRLLAGKSLCGVRVNPAKAPRLKMTEDTTVVTPLCKKCLSLNSRLAESE